MSRDPAVGEAYFSDPLVYPKATNRLGASLFEAMDELNESLTDLAIPTLVLHGSADTIVPLSPQPLWGIAQRRTATVARSATRDPQRAGGTGGGPGEIAWIDSRI